MKNIFSQVLKKVSMMGLCVSVVVIAPALKAEDRIDLGRDIRDRIGRDFRPIPSCAIDLAASAINFQLLHRTSTYRGQVRITGVLRNVGRNAYASGANQQSLLLYQDSRIVAQTRFANVARGGSVSVTFVRNWDASSPAEGEFPPTYRIVLSQDPDIFIDGNTSNDDCSSRNNTLSKSGTGINELF
jgi:hypothetical protein